MADEVSRQDYNSQRTLIGLDSNDEIKNVRTDTSGNLIISSTSGPNTTPTAGGNGTKEIATAGTPETLAASTACRLVKISNPSGNTGPAVWGFSSAIDIPAATVNGALIPAGKDSGWIWIDNLSKIYVDVTANGENLGYVYLV